MHLAYYHSFSFCQYVYVNITGSQSWDIFCLVTCFHAIYVRSTRSLLGQKLGLEAM